MNKSNMCNLGDPSSVASKSKIFQIIFLALWKILCLRFFVLEDELLYICYELLKNAIDSS